MSQHPTYSSEWFHHFRSRFDCWGHGNSHIAQADLEEILADVRELVAVERNTPRTVTVTTTQNGQPMTTFAPGATITFTAATDNAEGVALPTDLEGQPFTYTWTATAGTIVPGPDTTTITISDAPLGDVTATATDPNGLVGSVTATVADQTPASVVVTAS